MALALARKYRPSSFTDLVGQDTVSQTLSQALDSGRLSHAYLFSGLRGSGKTSTARIFSKALLCEKGPTSRPCNSCPHCIMANENRHMDIIEMDAASNRGIDDIKELIEHTKYKPGSGRFKIFIIDEVHMLTPPAFNALLKTLEEPPDFVKFILATTDPLKLPVTILSRTQHFRFKKIPPRVVLNHLEHILNLENIEYEPEALEIIARSGAGSLRDSLTLLDQAIVYAADMIDIATVTGMLGIIEPSILDKLLDNILQKNSTEILEFIHLSSEYETEMIIDELTLHLKELFLKRNHRFKPLILDRFFRILAEAKELLHIGSDGEFVLSLALFKMMEALSIHEIDDMIRTIQKELPGFSAKINPVTDTTGTSEHKSTTSVPEKNRKRDSAPDKNGEEKIRAEKGEQSSIPRGTSENITTLSGEESGALKFNALKEKLYDRNYELGECFDRNITYKTCDGSELVWESSAVENDKKILIQHWGLIRTFVQEIFGLNVKIKNITANPTLQKSSKTVRKERDECTLPDNASTGGTIEAVEFKENSCANHPDKNISAIEKHPSDLLDEPMVKEAIALFDPERVRIRRKS